MSKRSKSCTTNSINKLFENQINEIYNNYDEDKLTLLYSLKEVVERNLKKIVTLSEEIGEGIEDDEEFATHLDESMNIEVNVNHKLAILNEFITKKNRQLSHIYLKFRGLIQLTRQILIMQIYQSLK